MGMKVNKSRRSHCLNLVGALMLIGFLTPTVAPSFAGSHPPLGYQLMCLKTPSECKGGGSSKVKATSDIMAILKRVNHFTAPVVKVSNLQKRVACGSLLFFQKAT